MLNETFSVIFKHCDFGWFSNNVSKVFWRENSNIGVRQNRGTSACFMNKIFSLEPDFFMGQLPPCNHKKLGERARCRFST